MKNFDNFINERKTNSMKKELQRLDGLLDILTFNIKQRNINNLLFKVSDGIENLITDFDNISKNDFKNEIDQLASLVGDARDQNTNDNLEDDFKEIHIALVDILFKLF